MTTSNVGDGQSTTSLTLHPQDSENVFSGGRSIDTTILHAGTETVYAGGVASFTTISDDGYQVISVGGFATGATVDFGGIEGLSLSGTARGITVESSGNQTVEELGSSIDAIVHSSGTETIAGGALSIATTISSGGFETVASGGVTSDTTVRGDYEIIHAGAVVEDTIMSGGSAVILGSTISTTVRPANVGQLGRRMFSPRPRHRHWNADHRERQSLLLRRNSYPDHIRRGFGREPGHRRSDHYGGRRRAGDPVDRPSSRRTAPPQGARAGSTNYHPRRCVCGWSTSLRPVAFPGSCSTAGRRTRSGHAVDQWRERAARHPVPCRRLLSRGT